MRTNWNPQNFITSWLVSGPFEREMDIDRVYENQLDHEKYMRSIASDRSLSKPEGIIKYGDKSQLDLPWEYYYSPGNWFVDKSKFYSVPTRVEMYGSVVLKADKDIQIRAVLWTYAAIDLWIEEEHICQVDIPVYKPITKKELSFNLSAGEHLLFVRMQNIGIRDTRNLFGIEINKGIESIEVKYPDQENLNPLIQLDHWLSNITIKDRKLWLKEKADGEIRIEYKDEKIQLNEESLFTLPETISSVEVCGNRLGQELRKRFDILENYYPLYESHSTAEENNIAVFNRIAEKSPEDRSRGVYFSIFNVLARYATNRIEKKDRQYIFDTLDLIEKRIDCSDFLVVGLIRLVKEYDLDEEILSRVEDVLLNYRYWMDEKGSDGMCFWSENHALMFYGSALVAGRMYPDSWFTRSQKSGRQVYETAYRRCSQWLDDVEADGYEEFISGGYMCVTFGALLNLVDYGDEEISSRAVKLTDKLLEDLAIHTFKGSVIGPQGRVYRDVILPFSQGVQGLINLVDPSKPYVINDWLQIMATSRYQIPPTLIPLMETFKTWEYETGNALIRLKKTRNYVVTSVQSPREDKESLNWENISFDKEADQDSYHFVKSLNERYHGTTNFRPGIYGYQQHMWYCALDNNCVVFVNHPGGTFDGSSMRPGYWYGNGIMPAVKQVESLIGTIYDITEDYPIHFTHIFWPGAQFSEVLYDGNWLFGRKEESYIALWCSDKMVKHNDQLSDCEFRVFADKVAYITFCSSKDEVQSFEDFMVESREFSPDFNKEIMKLSISGDFFLEYKKAIDHTQYV